MVNWGFDIYPDMKRSLSLIVACLIVTASFAQYHSKLSADAWVDSVFKTLSKEQKIAQLMVIRAHSNLGPEHVNQVTELISKYNVGALCFFQGGPQRIGENKTFIVQVITQ